MTAAARVRPVAPWAAAAVVPAAVAVAAAAAVWPVPLAAAAGAGAVAGLALWRLDIALLLLVATIPLESAVQVGGGQQVTVTKLAGALCFLSFGVALATGRRRLRVDASHALLLGILLLALASMVGARNAGDAQVVTLRYASFVALYVVVTAFSGDRRTLERIAWVLSLSAAVAGALAVRNLLTGIDTRATPTYGDPNDLAYILASTLPLTLWLLRRRGWSRLLVVAMAATIALAVALTFSRGAAIGLGAALLWYVAARRERRRVIAGTLAVAAALITVVAAANWPRVQTALTDKGSVAGRNVDTRFDAWRSALELSTTHPLLGVGPGNFQFYTALVDDRPPTPVDPTVVHNTYLDVLAEVGVPALLLLLAYIGTVFGRLREVMRGGAGPPELGDAVCAATIVAVFAALTLSEQYYAPLWLMGALATCLWWETRDDGARAQQTTPA